MTEKAKTRKTVSQKQQMLWNAVGNILYLGAQWAVTILVTVLGDLQDAGILSVAMSVSASFQTVAFFGIRNFQVSDRVGKYSDSSYVSFRALTCGAALLLCLLFALVGGYEGEQIASILLFMLFRLAECYSDVLHGIAQKKDRLDIAGISFAIKGVALLASFLAVFSVTGSLVGGIAAMAAVSLLSTFCFDLTMVKRLSDFRLFTTLREGFSPAKETLPLCIYQFLAVAISTLPRLILEKQYGAEILGAYASIFAPAMLLQSAGGYLYAPFTGVFGIAVEKRDISLFWKLFAKLTGAVVLLFGGVFLLAWCFGDLALLWVFGEKIRPHLYLLTPILFVNFALTYLSMLSMLVIVLRRSRPLLIGYAVGTAAAAGLSFPAMHFFGVNGTSYAMLAAAALISIVMLYTVVTALRRPAAPKQP